MLLFDYKYKIVPTRDNWQTRLHSPSRLQIFEHRQQKQRDPRQYAASPRSRRQSIPKSQFAPTPEMSLEMSRFPFQKEFRCWRNSGEWLPSGYLRWPLRHMVMTRTPVLAIERRNAARSYAVQSNQDRRSSLSSIEISIKSHSHLDLPQRGVLPMTTQQAMLFRRDQ
jgi:hypothetical protein